MQSWQHVSVLCQFHLCLGVGGLCTHGEDVEDERSTVKYFHFQLVLYVAYLLCGKLIVENYHADFPFCVLLVKDILFYFLQLSLSYVGGLVRPVHFLRESLHRHGTCCVGKELKFVKIFF